MEVVGGGWAGGERCCGSGVVANYGGRGRGCGSGHGEVSRRGEGEDYGLLKQKDSVIAGVVWTMGCCGRGFLNLSDSG